MPNIGQLPNGAEIIEAMHRLEAAGQKFPSILPYSAKHFKPWMGRASVLPPISISLDRWQRFAPGPPPPPLPTPKRRKNLK